MTDESRLLLVTANVGTIFENLNDLLDPWLNEFSKKLDELKPDFVALHMQEIGGKNYKDSMQSINPFFKKFLSNPVIRTFNRYLVVVDSDFTDEMSFTSLGNVYLISERLRDNDVELFDFKEKRFFNYASRQIFTGSLIGLPLIYKERFVRNYFPEFQWSRKGFVQTKWRIKNQNYDLVNIHLFHDPSNLIALNSSPSIYSVNRKRALKYSIERIERNVAHPDELLTYSIFGDFNFRLDLASLINDFSHKSESIATKDKNNKLSRLVYKTPANEELFVIEEKKFKWDKSSAVQGLKNELLKYDIELSQCDLELYELVRRFPPSYPFREELDRPDEYMQSRCPSWCDRIVLNGNLKRVLDTRATRVDYSMLGENICMGDHKPIFLYFVVNNSTTTTNNKNDNCQPVTNQQQQQQQRGDNNHPQETTSTPISQNMINVGLKLVYINNSLANLDKPTTDIHDQACFKNVRVVRHLDELSAHYPRYSIANLHQPPQTTTTISPTTNLNAWLRSIAEFLVVAARHNTFEWCHRSSSTTSQQPQETTTTSSCECLIRGVEKFEALKTCWLRSSILLRFFLQAPLNGNFFKLKHLYAFLERTLESLGDQQEEKFAGPIETLGDEEISRPFESSSPRSAFVLGEIVRFLKTPCVYTVFKSAINEKRKSGCQLSSAGDTSSNNNNNNNDENFSNMNVNDDRGSQVKTINSASNSENATSTSATNSAAATSPSNKDLLKQTPLNGTI